MKNQSIPLAPQLVRETVDELATNPELGTAKEKVGLLLRAITGKCALCVATSEGHTGLNTAADCPLNDFGPSV